ncbi:DUF418 domain-containing protein [Paenibacillus amylolyticus]|uniref:DUF418 domain-containing protein n=1 Tax=Paenibacillus amylolyticus TaxID=1451 RepID=UPI003D99C6DC
MFHSLLLLWGSVSCGGLLLWMRWFQYGPLEWVWRCGTYLSFIPIRKKHSEPRVHDTRAIG